jgi:hypothetical protein
MRCGSSDTYASARSLHRADRRIARRARAGVGVAPTRRCGRRAALEQPLRRGHDEPIARARERADGRIARPARPRAATVPPARRVKRPASVASQSRPVCGDPQRRRARRQHEPLDAPLAAALRTASERCSTTKQLPDALVARSTGPVSPCAAPGSATRAHPAPLALQSAPSIAAHTSLAPPAPATSATRRASPNGSPARAATARDRSRTRSNTPPRSPRRRRRRRRERAHRARALARRDVDRARAALRIDRDTARPRWPRAAPRRSRTPDRVPARATARARAARRAGPSATPRSPPTAIRPVRASIASATRGAVDPGRRFERQPALRAAHRPRRDPIAATTGRRASARTARCASCMRRTGSNPQCRRAQRAIPRSFGRRVRTRDRGVDSAPRTSLDASAALFETSPMTRSIRLAGLARGSRARRATAASAGPRDPLYQWTDATGAVRYTSEIERIPDDQRSAAVTVAADRAPARPPPSRPPRRAPRNPARPPVDSAPPPGASAAPTDPRLIRLDARIAELEQMHRRDEAALGDYISDPERAAKKDDAGDVAAIADRLPKLQNELRELRELRVQGGRGRPPPDAAAPSN